MSKLIIICGQPASGKTTLVEALSKELRIPKISKDSIKEKLYEIRKLNSLDQSLEIGSESIKILLETAEKMIRTQQDLIIEAPFRYESDYLLFQSWVDEYQVQIFSIICQIDHETRKQRFYTRDRHPAHHDLERIYTQKDDEIYKTIPGQKFYITTDRPIEVITNGLALKIKTTSTL